MALNEMDARLISQGSETTAIGSSALVSVSDGEGQPQKNITLGNFADSMGAAVPQQQNARQVGITGLYARTSEGKMVELTKESVASVMGNLLYGADNASSLASVVAGMMGNPVGTKGIISGDLNDVSNGIYTVHNIIEPVTNAPEGEVVGILTCFDSPDSGMGGNPKYQTFSTFADSVHRVYSRTKWSVNWSPWQRIDNFGYNSLAELAAALKPLL